MFCHTPSNFRLILTLIDERVIFQEPQGNIVRLTTDSTTSRSVVDGLRAAGQQLKDDAHLHVLRWFEQGRDRTLKRIKGIPEGEGTTQDDLILVAELLAAALTR